MRVKYNSLIISCICLTVCLSMIAPQVASGETSLSVESGVICQGVVNREVQGENTSFAADVDKVSCFTKISGIKEQTKVTHVWYYGDKERSRIDLNVNPPVWRTYSTKSILPNEIGSWRVDVIDQRGNVLGTYKFEIVAKATAQ